MVKLLNSLYLGASTPDNYGKASGVVELLPFDLYLGAAVPSGKPKYIDVVLSGVSPLVLTNAIEDGLNYLKLFGGTELSPETYLDTVTLSGGCEQRNLPSGYTQVEYLESSGEEYIDTGYKPNNNTKVLLKLNAPVLNTFVFGSRSNTSGSEQKRFGLYFANYWNPQYGNDNYTGGLHQATIDTLYNVEMSSIGLFINGTLDHSFNTQSFVGNYNMYLFANNTADTTIGYGWVKIYSFEIYNSSTLVHNLIPCRRNSDNILGMYDTVTGTFLTNAGTGTFTAGADVVPTPDTPINIWCNNGVLKLNNVHNIATDTLGGFINKSSGEIVSNAGYGYTDYIPVTAGQVFKITQRGSSTTDADGIAQYDSNKVWQSCQEVNGLGGTYTVPSGISYIRPNFNINYQQFVIEDGIYTDGTQEVVTDSVGNTASAERLLAVGSYKDTQEVISGTVTRNVGIKVLDGTEAWTETSSEAPYVISIPDMLGPASADGDTVWTLNTHFIVVARNPSWSQYSNLCSTNTGNSNVQFRYQDNQSTLADFKQFLADQYANGTPVIIVYPLATATTETVTGQFLSKSPVTQTAGSISNLPISVTESSHTTPTPTQPLQINCNNGVIKYGNTSKNLISTASQYVLLGQCTDASGNVVNSSVNFQTITFPCKPNTTYTASISESVVMLRVCTYNSSGTFVQRYNTQVSDGVKTITFTTGASVTQFNIGAQISSSDTTQAMIDNINWQIEQGSSATSYESYSPASVYTDGTVETVEIHGKNLYNPATAEDGYLTDTGGFTPSNQGKTSAFIRVKPSTAYTLKFLRTAQDIYTRVCSYDSNEDFVSLLVKNTDITAGYITETFTTDANAKYIRVSFKADSTEVQLEQSSTATTYEPYFNGGTATAEMLLKVGTYKDEQSVIDGEVTRNVGIKVFDGTENWQGNDGDPYFINIPQLTGATSRVGLSNYFECTNTNAGQQGKFHFGGATVNGNIIFSVHQIWSTKNAWKQWLADQYSAGTPVIVVYPLAEPTTESVTGQPLTVQAGTNIVEITQASMDGLTMEVSYKAGVTVTITEVENAQLDNSVEVTING